MGVVPRRPAVWRLFGAPLVQRVRRAGAAQAGDVELAPEGASARAITIGGYGRAVSLSLTGGKQAGPFVISRLRTRPRGSIGRTTLVQGLESNQNHSRVAVPMTLPRTLR